MARRKALLISTPRTGSVYLSELIYVHYSHLSPRTMHLGGLINPLHFNLYYEDQEDGTKLNLREYREKAFRLVPTLTSSFGLKWERYYSQSKIDIQRETKRRLELLNQFQVSFVLNHHFYTEQLLREVLKVGYTDVFVCKRKDVWRQILSYGIALHTNKFKYVTGSTIDIAPYSVFFDKKHFDGIALRIKELDKLAISTRTIWYEDIRDEANFDVLEILGFPRLATKNISQISIKVPYKYELERYYDKKNLESVKIWYNRELRGLRDE